jgi:TRAP-type C4-dicarboxylate transport system permease small subunit
MENKVSSPGKGIPLIEKVANSFKKYLQSGVTALDWVGIAAFIVLTCMLVVSVIARKMGYPLKGVIELSEFGMALVIFSFMAANYFKEDQMTMDTFVEKIPKKGRQIIGSLVHLLNFVILGLLTWQLFRYGIMVQEMGQTSVNLRIPITPFIYFAAVCNIALTLVYILHFLNSLVTLSKSWRS